MAGPGGRIAGQARLVPRTWGNTVLRHGPSLGLMALTIVAELAAGDEQQRTLSGIRSGVDRLTARLDLDDDAHLRTAEQAIRSAHAALLDGAAIPESIGLGTAMSNLQVIRAREAALLTGWERVVAALPDTGATDGAELRTALGGIGALGWDAVPGAIGTAYLSLTLDSRRIVLSAAEAQLRNPGAPLTAFREAVEADLAARTDELARLRRLVRRLSTVPLSTSGWAMPHVVAGEAAENARTQALFASVAAALDGSDRTAHVPVVEAELAPDGAVQLLRT